MCGRYAVDFDEGDWVNDLKVDAVVGPDLGRRYNIAPTQPIRVTREDHESGQRELRTVRWGLVPSWAKVGEPSARMINARAETVTEKPAFRAAATRRRCLIPASGYYEWQVIPGGKQPYYLHGDDILAFAGLYELWWPKDRPDAEPLWTATIITAAAPDALGVIHDRTPVILPEAMWADWLSPAVTDRADVVGMLAAAPEPHLTPRRIGKAVGNIRNQGPGLIEPIDL